jgi:hypothetical protein
MGQFLFLLLTNENPIKRIVGFGILLFVRLFGIRCGKGVIVVRHAAPHLPFHHGNSQSPFVPIVDGCAVTIPL